ncbi:MAG: TAXI family TRAP transporter solute-binding subunit [Pseudomonadota bacterium]
MRKFIRNLTALAFCALAPMAQAQNTNQSIGIMAGAWGDTSTVLGEELGRAIDGWSGVNVKVMFGRGSEQNIDDLLFLRGVDFAFLNTDVMTNLRISNPDHPALDALAYLTKVADAEMHLLVRKDSGINSIQDLRGRRVSYGNVGSGSALTSRLMLRLFNTNVTGVFLDTNLALFSLMDGEVDGVFVVGAKPLPILQNIQADDNLKLVPISFAAQLEGIYEEAAFDAADYPNLVEDKLLPTISVPVVLAVYNKFAKNSVRYQNIVSFSDAFMETIPRLQQPPRHPKWQELDLDAEVEGWQRFSYFEDLIAQQ